MEKDLVIDIKIDATGEVCPMPAALARKNYRKAKQGEILEIFGDFESAADNIVEMIKKLGGEIISVEKGQGQYKVIFKKT